MSTASGHRLDIAGPDFLERGMRSSVRNLSALIATALVAFCAGAFAQTIRTPVPAQRFEQAPLEIESRIPKPLQSNATALAKLGLRPTDLDLGRSITFSVSRLYGDGGELRAQGVDITRTHDGKWILIGNPGTQTHVTVRFRTQREKRYVVEFAIDSRRSEFRVNLPRPGRAFRIFSLPLIDGLLAVPVTGSGTWQDVGVNGGTNEGFVLHFARVTPLIESSGQPRR